MTMTIKLNHLTKDLSDKYYLPGLTYYPNDLRSCQSLSIIKNFLLSFHSISKPFDLLYFLFYIDPPLI